MTLISKKNKSIFELLIATSIWGFSFVATQWSLESFEVLNLMMLRFLPSALLCIFIILIFPNLRKNVYYSDFYLSFFPGILISIALILQTKGLKLTNITHSGFITTLYIVFVPFIEFLFLRKKISLKHYFWVLISLIGAGLLTGISSFQGINKGDLLTLLCAIAVSIQIIIIDLQSTKIHSSLNYTIGQALWAGLICLVAAYFGSESLNLPDWNLKPWFGLLFLGFCSTIFSFTLQVKAQKAISASTASVIFLLEAPFASLFALFFCDEKITTQQSFGACLIIISAFAVVRIHRM